MWCGSTRELGDTDEDSEQFRSAFLLANDFYGRSEASNTFGPCVRACVCGSAFDMEAGKVVDILVHSLGAAFRLIKPYMGQKKDKRLRTSEVQANLASRNTNSRTAEILPISHTTNYTVCTKRQPHGMKRV